MSQQASVNSSIYRSEEQIAFYAPQIHRLFLLLVLLLGLVLRGSAIVNTDQFEVLNRPIVDDSFYYFSFGRHLAAGHGATIDGEHLTTGFQPLWGFMGVIPYLLFPNSDSAAIVTFQLMGIAVGLLCAVVIYGLARRLSKSRWIALAVMGLWWLAPQGVIYQTGGMETALGVFATMLIFYVVLLVLDKPSVPRMMMLGAVCGFAFLCRTDTLALTVAVLMGMAPTLFRLNRAALLQKFVLFAVCMALVLSPWVMFTRSLGKGFMPESGEAVRLISAAQFLSLPLGPANINQTSFGSLQNLSRLSPFLISYLQDFALNLYLTLPIRIFAVSGNQAGVYNAALIGFVLFVVVLLLVFRRNRERQWRTVMTIWLLYAMAMTALYSFYVIGYWFNQRYTLPPSESLAVLAACFLLSRLKSVKRSRLVLLAASVMLVFGATYTLYYLFNPAYSWIFFGPASPIDNELEAASVWMNANIAPTARIGAFQSGLMGYYSHSQFINLDGKVNNAAHKAMQAGDMWNYVCNEAKLDYVVDMQIVMEALLIHRSQNWDEGNLTLVHGTGLPPSSPMWQPNIYQVHCPTTPETQKN